MSTDDSSYTTSLVVDRSPEEVFAAINDVRGWWSGDIDGTTDELGAEFTYRYEDVHRSRQRITELAPGRRVVWHVLDADLTFVGDRDEWTGTDIVFDISPAPGGTHVRFTHLGLVSGFECYEACSDAWGGYISRGLRDRITRP